MAGKKLRRIRFGSERKSRQKSGREARGKAPETMAPAPQRTPLDKRDIAAKLIALGALSAKEAQRAAEKAIDHVLAAITHALSEGDLSISEFGELKALRNGKTGEIGFSFAPCDKIKRAVEARLLATMPKS